jgi:hypothetical protein
MEDLLAAYPVPEEKEMLLYTYVRLAHGFSDYATRLKSVQARLQALSVLIYSNQLTDSIQVICMMFSGSDIVSGISGKCTVGSVIFDFSRSGSITIRISIALIWKTFHLRYRTSVCTYVLINSNQLTDSIPVGGWRIRIRDPVPF